MKLKFYFILVILTVTSYKSKTLNLNLLINPFYIILLFIQVNCLCDNKKIITTPRHREYFLPISSLKCSELSLGPFNTNYVIIIFQIRY